MIDFSKSFNIVLGTSNKEINWFDNPYIQVNAYDIDENFAPKPNKNVRLRNCQKEDLTKFMAENVAEYYPNALCFDDFSKLSFLDNWFDSKFKNIFIAIEAC